MSIPASKQPKTKADAGMPFQELQQHAPTDLLNAVLDVLITTKILSEFLRKPKDLCRFSGCARSFLPFRCQVRELRIRRGGLTEGLLRHMQSGGLAEVTTIELVTRYGSYSRPSPLPEHLKHLLRSASSALTSLTYLELWSGGFVLELLLDLDPAVRARLQDLQLDPGHGSEATLKSLLEGSPNLQALSLINMRDEEHLIECLAHAFKTCKSLRALDLYINHFDDENLPALLAPILEGQAPNLKELYFFANLWDGSIDIVVQCFPILSVLGFSSDSFSRRGKAQVRQAAENYPALTLCLPDNEEDYDDEEEGEDEEEIGGGNEEEQEGEEGSDDEAEISNDTEEEDG
jgi:hypothetical protein